MRYSRKEFNFSVVLWLPLLPVLMLCIGDYFRKKTSSKTDLCWKDLINNASVAKEGVDWFSTRISRLRRLFDFSESISMKIIKMDKITNVNRIGISHETLRRRALNYVHEAQNTLTNLHSISTQLQGFHHKDLNNETVSSIQASLIRYRQNVEEIILHLEIILNKLDQLDGFSQIRIIGLDKLSQRLQKKIQEQQNPSDCKMAKYVTFDFTNLCGFGCSMHQLMFCFQLAFESERVLIVMNHPPGDVFREWLHQNTLPLSEKCSHVDTNGRSDNIRCPFIRYGHIAHNWLPHVLPIDMNAELLRLHEAPFVWFAGQLASYILRPRPQFAQLINATLKSFKASGNPVVGVHIRRTDKIIYEAKFHNLSEYMKQVDKFFDRQNASLLTMSKRHDIEEKKFGSIFGRTIRKNNSAKRSVYLATDDPNVFTQFPYSHPNYILYGSPGRSHSADLRMRKTYNSINNAIIDVIALSMTDFLVCTFSSNICRLAYELMQTRHMEFGDATQLCHSIDFAFHQEDYSRLKFDVIIPDMKGHLKYGDVVDNFINHGNGSASVKLEKNAKNEFFIAPAYKFRPTINMTWFN
uniref:Alpha 1,6 fucosyltransferase K n=1 Tax=Schistosoma mansoni TaxID=6183 RepID=A0A3Q0KMV6_SCHMA